MDTKKFLKSIKDAFEYGDLNNRSSLYQAIGGANYLSCGLSDSDWTSSLANATTEWFSKWPKSESFKFCDGTLFLGKHETAVANQPYFAYRLSYLPRIISDLPSEIEIEEALLIEHLTDDLKRRSIVWVTDWDELTKEHCCVADALEKLGLGDTKVEKFDKRVVSMLEIHGNLHRPTWIDSGFWIFWMYNQSNNDTHGYTRELKNGNNGVKEWVCHPKDVKVKSAKIIRARRAIDLHLETLPASFWGGAKQWVIDRRTNLTS